MDFFTQFPIVVMSTGNYTRDYNFNIEDVFKVEWTKETKHIGKNWYNIHYQKEDSPRILIHTWQFSAPISNELINIIASECKQYL